MRSTVLVVLLLATLVQSFNPNNWILIRDESGEYEEVINLDAETQLPEPRLKENEIFFYYSSSAHKDPIKLILGDAASALKNTDFNPSRPTYLIVHGWHNDFSSKLNQLVGSAILSKVDDCNLIVTDWSAGASGLYIAARADVPVVGQAVASIVKELGLDTNVLTIIGHSLGAHASGIAGADLSQSLGPPAQIVGLDAALPLFELTGEDGRLDPSDAKLIHVIHTCAGVLGFVDPIGHVDYYPGEGGKAQPGCGLDTFCTCAHGRSYEYYAESIRTGGFTATSCDNYEDYKTGTCNNNPRSQMGGLHLDVKANGTYFLHVNDREPYSLG